MDLCDAISVRYEGGATTLASTGGIPAAQIGHQQHELRVYGSEGYALVDVMAGSSSIFSNDGSIEEFDAVPADRRYPTAATSRHLVDLVLGVAPAAGNASTGEIGLRTVELLEAAYLSAAERRVVSIDELYRGAETRA